jgi:hypothetical protein
MLLPALAKAKTKAQGILCMNNGKQMMLAMALYVSDFEDFYPPNPDDANTQPGHNWCPGDAGAGGAEEFNPDVLRNPQMSLLLNFIGNDIAIFKCPADRRLGVYTGKDPALAKKKIQAVRTFSMSQAVGTICPGFDTGSGHNGKPSLAVNGPWLDGGHGHKRNTPYRTYGKASHFVDPGPSQTWVLLDEDADSLNDAGFGVGMPSAKWIDFPGTYHNMACGFAFADGHSEIKKWSRDSTRVINHVVSQKTVTGSPDWDWVRRHTSANANGAALP